MTDQYKEAADAFYEVLSSLIKLKGYKDLHGKDPSYVILKPKAWGLAKKLVESYGRYHAQPVRKVSNPRAWATAKAVPRGGHNKNCAFRVTYGGVLCDCPVLIDHPEYTSDE